MDLKTKDKWMMYHIIHQEHRDGKKPSQIAAHLGLDTRTVKKVLAMDEQEYEQYLICISTRRKKLQDYEDFVKQRIEKCLDASAAQVHDWLKEAYPDFMAVSERTVYNFVMQIRSKYGLAKVFSSRQFSMVDELPYGQQAQIDFGEYNMTDAEGKRKKVYFFSLVLSRSRYKHVVFRTEPFTTETTIVALEQSFAFINGYPEELVLDQDKLLLYKENYGDLILTDKFRDYCMGRPFRLYFCRKADPQTKGKVENVIKYVKYNFLRGRDFYDIHTLNIQAKEWLDRTANAKVHATTHKVPAQEWIIEKPALFKLNIMHLMTDNKVQYNVRIDNVIVYKGSQYSLPIGTYKGQNTYVCTQQDNGYLIISDENSVEIIRHKISLVKGAKVRNNHHFRDTSLKINELIEQVAARFSDKEKATTYLLEIRKRKPRYVRDQVKLISKICDKYDQDDIDKTLDYCAENKIFNATDFEPVLLAISQMTESTDIAVQKSSAISKYKIIPDKTSITDYKQIL